MKTGCMVILILFCISSSSCRKDNDDSFDYSSISKQYVPFKVGSQLIYQVDSTIYDDFNDTVIKSTLFRGYTIDSMDNSIKTRTLFRVVVEETEDLSAKWQHIHVEQWARTEQYFETQVNNFRFTHIIFPPNYNSVWNAHQYNNFQNQPRYFLEIGDTFLLDSILYEDVVKIENEPKLNEVVDIQYFEVFSKNIGCIYKKISNIETQANTKSGYRTESKLYEYN